MTISTINRVIQAFSGAFSGLRIDVPMTEIERLAMAVHCDMEHGQRVYHTTSHALEMCRDMAPRQVLAALYHDLVYYQLDGGFPEHAETQLRQVAQTGGDAIILRRIAPGDVDLALCAGVFGFAPGDELPVYGGLNEFLSAVVAVRRLSPWLNRADLLAIVACIEATIPFRKGQRDGASPSVALAARMRAVNAEQAIGLDGTAIDGFVHEAIAFANRDVGNFASENPAWFLAGTWMLIEESNAPLARAGLYSIQDYRNALLRMENFLKSLDPAHVFHSYGAVPDAAEMTRLQGLSSANLRFSIDYLGAKLGALAVIEAAALETGGDAPISMFLGDIAATDGEPDRIENFLPAPLPCSDAVDENLLAVMVHGRARGTGNDLTASPMTAFLYRSLGSAAMSRLIDDARALFSGAIDARSFLQRQPADLVGAIIDACSRIALSRSERLRDLRQSLRRQ